MKTLLFNFRGPPLFGILLDLQMGPGEHTKVASEVSRDVGQIHTAQQGEIEFPRSPDFISFDVHTIDVPQFPFVDEIVERRSFPQPSPPPPTQGSGQVAQELGQPELPMGIGGDRSPNFEQAFQPRILCTAR